MEVWTWTYSNWPKNAPKYALRGPKMKIKTFLQRGLLRSPNGEGDTQWYTPFPYTSAASL